MSRFTTLAFDADDTLWHTESHFQEVQAELSAILEKYASHDEVQAHLHEIEVRNIKIFGYGVKGFTLSMVEAAIEISNSRITAADIHRIVMMGKAILEAPMVLMDGIVAVLDDLRGDHRLVMVTKGDVMDQRNKIEQSGLEPLFESTHVVQEKDQATYARVFADLGVAAADVVMIGNSLKSECLPVLELGGTAVHIPYHVT